VGVDRTFAKIVIELLLQRSMSVKTRAWKRIMSSIVLIVVASYCALQVIGSGIAVGDMYGVGALASEATKSQHKGNHYFLACVSILALNGIILTPLFPSWEVEAGNSVLPQNAARYVLAVFTSVIGTSIVLGILIWVMRTFE
jgi:hypothetical protein